MVRIHEGLRKGRESKGQKETPVSLGKLSFLTKGFG
jgi:hypothetical protein